MFSIEIEKLYWIDNTLDCPDDTGAGRASAWWDRQPIRLQPESLTGRSLRSYQRMPSRMTSERNREFRLSQPGFGSVGRADSASSSPVRLFSM